MIASFFGARLAIAETSGAPRTPSRMIASTPGSAAALHGDALPGQLRHHAEDVQHRQVDSVRRQRSEAGEVRLILELERPRERAEKIDAVLFGEEMFPREDRRGVAREHRPVAVAELRTLARGAAVGIGLADHYRFCFQLGERSDARERLGRWFASCAPMPMRTWPSTKLGEPFAWNEMKSIGVPVLPVA